MEQETIDSVIDNWYITTVYEIINGEPISELEFLLKDFEEDESYLECAGIKKAIDLAYGKTIKELRLEYKELITIRTEEDGT